MGMSAWRKKTRIGILRGIFSWTVVEMADVRCRCEIAHLITGKLDGQMDNLVLESLLLPLYEKKYVCIGFLVKV